MPPRLDSLLPAPLPLRDGVRVLELGTGDGTTILQVASWARGGGRRGEFVGLDRDPSRAEPLARAAAAAGVAETVRFARGDAFGVPPELGQFDVLLCCECLSQFVFEGLPARVSPDAVRARLTDLLTHWRTLLTPGGVLVIAETDRDAAGDAAARGIAIFERERWPLIPNTVLDAVLAATGFDELITRASLRQENASRDEMEQSMGAGAYRRLPRGNFPPPPFPPRVPQATEGPHELHWRVVQARAGAAQPAARS